MKLLLTVLTSIFFSLTSFGQLTTNVSWTDKSSMNPLEVIYYNPNKQLVWSNFLGQPQERGNVAAITVSGFGYTANIKTTGGRGVLNIKVYCYFNKNKSWVKPGKTTAYILTHEQNHFDISYIGATIFMDKLQGAVFTTSNYNIILPRIYNQAVDIMNKMQDDYDGQTDNGQRKDIQLKWNTFISQKISYITK